MQTWLVVAKPITYVKNFDVFLEYMLYNLYDIDGNITIVVF